jgi:hypothetical protein
MNTLFPCIIFILARREVGKNYLLREARGEVVKLPSRKGMELPQECPPITVILFGSAWLLFNTCSYRLMHTNTKIILTSEYLSGQ